MITVKTVEEVASEVEDELDGQAGKLILKFLNDAGFKPTGIEVEWSDYSEFDFRVFNQTGMCIRFELGRADLGDEMGKWELYSTPELYYGDL